MRAATIHIWMQRLSNVVRHYMEYVCSTFYKPFYVIDFTRRKVVKMGKTVSGV